MKQLWEYFWTTTYETSFRLLQLSDNFWENINNFQPSLDNFETSEIKLNFETTLRQLWGSFGTTLRQLGDSFSGDQMVTTIVTIGGWRPSALWAAFFFPEILIKVRIMCIILPPG